MNNEETKNYVIGVMSLEQTCDFVRHKTGLNEPAMITETACPLVYSYQIWGEQECLASGRLYGIIRTPNEEEGKMQYILRNAREMRKKGASLRKIVSTSWDYMLNL
jgi:hypothetical protein